MDEPEAFLKIVKYIGIGILVIVAIGVTADAVDAKFENDLVVTCIDAGGDPARAKDGSLTRCYMN